MPVRFFLRRVAFGVTSLLVLTVVIFLCTQLLPGDAATVLLGDTATDQALEEVRRQLGLDRPLPVQYLSWLGNALQGDFGRSMALNQSVSALVWPPFLASLQLAGIAFVSVAVLGIAMGVAAALAHGRKTDWAVLTVAYGGISVPEFVLGPLLILIFASPPLQLLPSSGAVSFSEGPGDWLRHMILPTATLCAVLIAHVVRQTRSGVLAVSQSEYIRAARLHGLPPGRVTLRYILPNALTTAVAVLALDIGYLMGSVVVVEQIFAYPGLGRLMLFSISSRDLQLVQACTLLIGTIYIFANLVADLVQGWLDPRIAERQA
ncbi:ABC transporter permease [Poseidonocella sp. HB161398]|uniref:ABC transporter permease n=1 Tax=Poseidonocella sp. HB161398 TaxID=2320855 RepID=UPI0011092E0A|nr:ABC transporter permease [Poseidonocella sp. HB161398]